MHNSTVFREYDIRGRYLKDFDSEFAFKLGYAFTKFCAQQEPNKKIKISVGKDARHSSNPIIENLTRGIVLAGAEVLDLGLITSPICYFSCYHIKDLTGAIMVTGSHNPPEYNGFKISFKKQTLTSDKIKLLETFVEKAPAYDPSLSAPSTKFDILTPYIDRIASEFNFTNSKIKFIADCGNGAAGSALSAVLKACNLKNYKILFEKPDGDFPNHHPDPTLEENLIDLKKEISKENAHFGVGYDGDADRIVIVDENGKTLYADELMSVYAKFILQNHPGAQIVADVKCSDEYYKLLTHWGAKPLMWKTGHSLIKQKVQEISSPFGGEFSGHIFFNERFYGFDDALYCTLRFIEILEKEQKTVSDLLSYFPKTYSTPEIRIDVGEKEKYQLIEKYLKEIEPFAKSINKIDGARVTFADGWSLARVSNTQPAVTLRFEGSSSESLKKIINISDKILGLNLKKYT